MPDCSSGRIPWGDRNEVVRTPLGTEFVQICRQTRAVCLPTSVRRAKKVATTVACVLTIYPQSLACFAETVQCDAIDSMTAIVEHVAAVRRT